MKAVLQLTNNKLQLRQEFSIALAQHVSFGRSGGSDFVIDDGKMSGKHCRLILKEDRMEIFDLSSKNGTYLNGIRIDNSELFIGDEIRIGDTFITLLASKLEQEVIDILTFPGPFKERVQYELKADFTGAREKNQDYSRQNQGERSRVFSAHEIELRKKARTKLRLSKDEIRSKAPVLSILAFIIDLAVLLGMIIMPIYFIGQVSQNGFLGISGQHFAGAKILYIGILEIAVIGIYLSSQKYLKYTIGEKITGIEDLHLNQ